MKKLSRKQRLGAIVTLSGALFAGGAVQATTAEAATHTTYNSTCPLDKGSQSVSWYDTISGGVTYSKPQHFHAVRSQVSRPTIIQTQLQYNGAAVQNFGGMSFNTLGIADKSVNPTGNWQKAHLRIRFVWVLAGVQRNCYVNA